MFMTQSASNTALPPTARRFRAATLISNARRARQAETASLLRALWARWGATVLLSGNALGDDDHGRFLGRELERIPNLTYKPQIDPTKQTPYAILLKAGGHGVGTLLSPSAARVKIHKQVQDNAVAGFFFGDPAGFGEGGESSILGAPTQDYDALLASLEAVATCYLSLLGEEVSPHEKAAFVSL
jgi:hypothetical protein